MSLTANDILAKATLPTHLYSSEIRDSIAAEIRRRSVFSARTTEAGYLSRLRQILADVAAGRIDDATARAALQRFLDQAGYSPERGFPGDPARGVPPAQGLTDLSSRARLDLILRTNRLAASSVAMARADTAETLAARPAWKLERYIGRREPRADWPARWRAAGDSVGWDGAARGTMAALKSSPIWQALGNGAGGYTDTLGNPYPPFAFGSGLAWTPVSAEEVSALGLDPAAARPKPATLSPSEAEIRAAVERLGPDFAAGLTADLEGAA